MTRDELVAELKAIAVSLERDKKQSCAQIIREAVRQLEIDSKKY